ncbi:hypothetical protein I5Q11_00020 [Serratia ureilytica]|nr:hypothetical protein [Serratia ureilytica]MBH2756014.1 hypothetical protein [Serratia ureilytica]MBH2924052.1 hypothetical protein [Serratia ureilytica]
MQTAFVVLILPGVAQRLLVLRALPLRRVGYLQRRAIQIGLIPVNIRRAAVTRPACSNAASGLAASLFKSPSVHKAEHLKLVNQNQINNLYN